MMDSNKILKRIVIDMDLCIGCKSCESACFISHQNHPNLVESVVESFSSLPYHCRHCEDPICVASCPKEALVKNENNVIERYICRCIGCKSCAISCPFGAISSTLSHYIVNKCNLCKDITVNGKEPRCVSTCSSGALKFIEINDVINKNLYGARVLGKPGIRKL